MRDRKASMDWVREQVVKIFDDILEDHNAEGAVVVLENEIMLQYIEGGGKIWLQ